MNPFAVCVRPLTVILFVKSRKLTGMSLPECFTMLPCLKLPKGTVLGKLTGQFQTDGQGNTTRVEIEMAQPVFWLCLCRGKGWMLDEGIRSAVRKAPNQRILIWVKPSEIQHTL